MFGEHRIDDSSIKASQAQKSLAVGFPFFPFLGIVGSSLTAPGKSSKSNVKEDRTQSSVVQGSFGEIGSSIPTLKEELSETTVSGKLGFTGKAVNGFHFSKEGGRRDHSHSGDTEKPGSFLVGGEQGGDLFLQVADHLFSGFNMSQQQTNLSFQSIQEEETGPGLLTGQQGSDFSREEPFQFRFSLGSSEQRIDGREPVEEPPTFLGIDIDFVFEGVVERSIAFTQGLMEPVLVGSVSFDQSTPAFGEGGQGFSVFSEANGSQPLRPEKLSFGGSDRIPMISVSGLLDKTEMTSQLGVEFFTGNR